jgi:hypothetical protein
MSYDEFPPYTIDSGKPSHSEMDAKFCARMHAAIVEGLESAPIGIITTPGTKNPKYVANQAATYHRWAAYRRRMVSGRATKAARS